MKPLHRRSILILFRNLVVLFAIYTVIAVGATTTPSPAVPTAPIVIANTTTAFVSTIPANATTSNVTVDNSTILNITTVEPTTVTSDPNATTSNVTELVEVTTVATDNSTSNVTTTVANVATSTESNTTLNESIATTAITDPPQTQPATDPATTQLPNSTTSEPLNTTIVATTPKSTTDTPAATNLTTKAPTTPATTKPPTTHAPSTIATTIKTNTTDAPTTKVQTTAKVTEKPSTEAPDKTTITTNAPSTAATTEKPGTTVAPELKCNASSEVLSSTEINKDAECLEATNTNNRSAEIPDKTTVYFPLTMAGNFAKTNESCKSCENDNVAIGVRKCNLKGIWENATYINCTMGVDEIKDPAIQAEVLLVSSFSLSTTNGAKATKFIGLILESSKKPIHEETANNLLVVVNNLLSSQAESLNAVQGSGASLRNGIQNIAAQFGEGEEKSFSKFTFAVKKSTDNRKRKRRETCDKVIVAGTDEVITAATDLSNVLLASPTANKEFKIYSSASECGEDEYVFIIYPTEDLFQTSTESNINSLIFYTSPKNTSKSVTIETKLQLYSDLIPDFVDVNATHVITTNISSECVLWEEFNKTWSATYCTTKDDGVTCSCNKSGNVALRQSTKITYKLIHSGKSGLSPGAIAGIVVGSIVAFFILLAIIVFICKAKNEKGSKITPSENGYEMGGSRNGTPNGRSDSR